MNLQLCEVSVSVPGEVWSMMDPCQQGTRLKCMLNVSITLEDLSVRRRMMMLWPGLMRGNAITTSSKVEDQGQRLPSGSVKVLSACTGKHLNKSKDRGQLYSVPPLG